MSHHSPPSSSPPPQQAPAQLDISDDALSTCIALDAAVWHAVTNRDGQRLKLDALGGVFVGSMALSLILRQNIKRRTLAIDNPAMTFDFYPGDKIHLEISHSKSLTVLKAVHRQELEVRSFSNIQEWDMVSFRVVSSTPAAIAIKATIDERPRPHPLEIRAVVTTEHNSLSEYFVHPTDALSPHLRTTVRVRHGGNDRTMSQLPVATGCALFLRFLAGAVEEFEKSGGESFKNFNASQLLLWARRIDATVVPHFTNVEIEALLSRLDRTHLRRFRTWASHLFNQSLANDEVAKKWAKYWTSNFRPLPPAEERRLEEVFVIVMEELDYILALHNPDPAPLTAAAASLSAREEVPPPYPRTPHSATLPSRPVVQAPSSSSRRPSLTASHRRSSVVHGDEEEEPRPAYETAQSYSSSRHRRREEGRR